MRIVRSPLANSDLAEIADFLGQDSPDLGLRFLSAARETVENLVAMPELGGVLELIQPNSPMIRVWPIRGFENYLLIYHPIRDGIKIVRILHGARDISALLREE